MLVKICEFLACHPYQTEISLLQNDEGQNFFLVVEKERLFK